VTQGTEFGNSISGAGSIEQAGTGATTLNVANSHTGGTTISAGTLVIDDASALGTGAVTLSGGILAENVASNNVYTNDIVASAATSSAIIATSGGNSDFSGTLSGSGTLNFGGTGDGQVGANVRNFGSWSGSFSGTITHESVVGGNNFFLDDLNTPSLKLSTSGSTSISDAYTRFAGINTIGELSGTGGVIRGRNGTLTVNQSTDTTYSGQLADENSRDLTFIKDGSGSLTLDFANTYTGGTTLNAGTLVLGDAAAVGTGAITLAGGTLEVAADIGNDISATGSTTIVNNTGTLSLSGGSVTGTGTLAFSVANETRFFSDLSGFSGTVSHDNDTGGQLRLWNQVEDLSGTKIVTSGGTSNGGLQFIGNNNHTIGELSGTGGIINMRGSSGLTLTIDQSTDTTYSGLLQDGDTNRKGSLVKDGSGTLTFDGANTYTGTTTVSGGTLALATGYTHSGGGAYTVEGGTLKIADGVNIGSAMTIGLGGVISPGNSPGTANTGAQTWNDGVNDSGGLKGEDPGWDWLDITGTLDLTNLSAGGFTIDIDSLTASNVAGDAVGFDTWTKGNPGDVDYSFIIASASGGITDFSADKFSFDSSGFTNGSASVAWHSLCAAAGKASRVELHVIIPSISYVIHDHNASGENFSGVFCVWFIRQVWHPCRMSVFYC
jgi:autotransporter-associated beta strand protein